MSKLLDRVAALEAAKQESEKEVRQYPVGMGELYELLDQRRAAGLPLFPGIEGEKDE